MGFEGVEDFEPFQVKDFEFPGGSVRVARMGFTADLGYECWFGMAMCPGFEELIRSVRTASGRPQVVSVTTVVALNGTN